MMRYFPPLLAAVLMLPFVPPTALGESNGVLEVVPAIKSVENIAPNQFQITWEWTVGEQPNEDWKVFVHFVNVVDGNHKDTSVGDFNPDPPTSLWKPGTTVLTTSTANVPAGASGIFDIRAGLYQDAGSRAKLNWPMDAERRVLVGRLKIEDGQATFIAPVKDDGMVAVAPAVKSVETVSPSQFRIKWEWTVREQPKEDWRVFVHFVDGNGEVPFVGDFEPDPPTPSWKPGTLVLPPTVVNIPGGVSGSFDICVGLFQSHGAQERARLDGPMDEQRRVLVGRLKIEGGKATFIPAN